MTELHDAVLENDIPLVKQLLANNANVNSTRYYDNGETPLHFAVLYGYIECVELLINATANVNVQDNDKDTPLHDAAQWNNTECARLLIRNGANVNAKNAFGDTPLSIAKNKKHMEMIEIFRSENEEEKTTQVRR
ncbi:ankyrin repeat domain-containing protein [Candidatus Pacearchaeota archaeon]|nr:ankyrin repeat domain-containing protein [Candidatus Pacearchaeota archaeon]